MCLNSEQTIEQTIQSVVGQNYSDIEYIIIDGGSTDRTLEIIAKYREKITVLVSEPDEGIYDAMNKGISMASGDVIGIINSDDWYEDGVFEYVGRQFEDRETQVLYANANMIDKDIIVSQWNYTEIENLMWKMIIPHPTVFVKKEIYKTYGVFDTQYKISADYDLMLRLYVNGVKFKYCDKTFVNFRCDGVSQRNVELTLKDSWRISMKHLERLADSQKDKWMPVIEKDFFINYSWYVLSTKQDRLLKVLTEKYLNRQTGIAVWGAGKGGSIMCDALQENNYVPAFIADNNPQYWNTCMKGIEIVQPDRLERFRGYVFIMVKFHSQEIAEYIEKMNNPNLTVVRWEELVEKGA